MRCDENAGNHNLTTPRALLAASGVLRTRLNRIVERSCSLLQLESTSAPVLILEIFWTTCRCVLDLHFVSLTSRCLVLQELGLLRVGHVGRDELPREERAGSGQFASARVRVRSQRACAQHLTVENRKLTICNGFRVTWRAERTRCQVSQRGALCERPWFC